MVAPERRVTLADVAARAGVAKSTVSRVLNNYQEGFSVGDEVRERVVRAAEDLGYSINPLWRTLKAKRTRLVQLIDQDIPSLKPSGDRILGMDACLRVLQGAGYTVTGSFQLHEDRQRGDEELATDFRVDGAVMTAVADIGRLRPLEQEGLPYAVINGEAGRGGIAVRCNDTLGTQLALRHLHDLGHRRIAYLSAVPTQGRAERRDAVQHYSVEQREQAYSAFCQLQGIERIPGWDDRSWTPAEFLRHAIDRHRATAILCYGHVQALEVHQLLRARGDLQRPRDLSLMCFNDIFPTDLPTPALSAVKVPFYEMGRLAGELLLRLMDGDPDEVAALRGTSHVIDPSLTLRESTAPPPEES